jgi:hypothetical protein
MEVFQSSSKKRVFGVFQNRGFLEFSKKKVFRSLSKKKRSFSKVVDGIVSEFVEK